MAKKTSSLTMNRIKDKAWIQRVLKGTAFYNWNDYAWRKKVRVTSPSAEQLLTVEIRSECLRDGVGAFKTIPNEADKKEYLRALIEVGVNMPTLDIFSSVDLDHLSLSNEETLRILEWLRVQFPKVRPVILARAMNVDLAYLKIARQINQNIIGLVFQDLSEVRRYVEGWGEFKKVLTGLVEFVKEAREYKIEVMGFTENLSITTPNHVRHYIRAMCEAGANWIGISDTAGRLLPEGTVGLVSFVKKEIDTWQKTQKSRRKVGIVFHGHNDMGNALSNSIAAIGAGATIIDTVTNGLGERVGNTNLIELLANIEYRLQDIPGNGRFRLNQLRALSQLFSRITGTDMRLEQPLVGERVFTTYFGIHANYFLKLAILAENMKDEGVQEDVIVNFLSEAWKVYSAESPAALDMAPDIRISYLSGYSNVIFKLKKLRLIEDVRVVDRNDPAVQEIISRAKGKLVELPDVDVEMIWKRHH